MSGIRFEKMSSKRLILETASKEELIDFILKYAARNEQFDGAIDLFFDKPEFDEAMSKIKKMVDNALDHVSDYYRRGRWGHVHVDTSSIHYEIKTRKEQGHVKIAFCGAEYLYRKLLELFELGEFYSS